MQTALEAKFDQATLAHKQGRLIEAERIYADILRQQPNHFNALYGLGIIAAQTRQTERAAELFRKAIRLNDRVAGVHRNLGNALLELGKPNDALLSYEQAIALSPDDADAYSGRGLALQDLKRFEDSIECFDSAIALMPEFAEAHYHRGNTLRDLGRLEEAVASFDKAISINPDFSEAYINRGNVLRKLERVDEALSSFDKAIALNSESAEAYNNRGNALQYLGRLDEALASFHKAIAIKPYFAEAYSNRGNVLKNLQRLDEALSSFEKAIALKPAAAEAYTNRGNVLKELGQLQRARDDYVHALQLDPGLIGVYLNLAYLKTFSSGDPHVAAMQSIAAHSKNLSSFERMQLDFALGKAYADVKDYRRSFMHLLAGNTAKRATIRYDESSVFDYFNRIETLFTRDLITSKSGMGFDASMPIFVIGMPRSGTTLIEQILVSHPMVHGAGELSVMSEVSVNFLDRNGIRVPYPEFVSSLEGSGLWDIGERYVACVRGQTPEGKRVTDKMPSNYYYAGLIHLALPNAKIVHTIRDPIDTCISCFAYLFGGEQNHTYELGEIGRYYRRYQRLMAHWHRVLPVGSILDVQYENIIADLEGQVRRILEHCGLPWDDRCLMFHKTERPVQTASALQVRQPIYKTAVGRWRVYEEFLGPLLSELGRPASANQ